MPQQAILTFGLGGLGTSYATVQDLENISLPRKGKSAIILSGNITAPFALNTKTLKVYVVTDGIKSALYTQTFTLTYNTLDSLVAAISIPGVKATNQAGKLQLETIAVGAGAGLIIDYTGTANQLLGFNYSPLIEQNQEAFGHSTLTSDITEDEKAYALVTASSIADGYLQRRFKMPISNWDFSLIKAVCDIAAFIIVQRRGYTPQNSKGYDLNFKESNDKAIEWLSDVGNRKIHPNIKGSVKPNPYAGLTFSDDFRGWLTLV